jgi:TniQ protein
MITQSNSDGRPLIRAWTYQLESLPFNSPPLRGELLNSYLARLTDDNQWDLQTITTHLGEVDSTVRSYSGRPDHWRTGELILNSLAIERLAALTGYPATTLTRTLGILGTHRRRTPREDIPTLHWSALYAKPVRTADTRVIRPCPRCTAKRGITATVSVLCHIDQPSCPRHGTWLIDYPATMPFTTARHPDLTKALRHHHNLRRRHPADQLTTAFRTARTLWFRYKPGTKPEHFDPIQQRWTARAATLSPYADRNWLAVLYPEIVTLTSVLISPYWTAAAARPYIKKPFRGQRPDLRDFLEEIARRIHHPDPGKFAQASSSIGAWARETYPGHAKLKFGYYPTSRRKGPTKMTTPQ